MRRNSTLFSSRIPAFRRCGMDIEDRRAGVWDLDRRMVYSPWNPNHVAERHIIYKHRRVNDRQKKCEQVVGAIQLASGS